MGSRRLLLSLAVLVGGCRAFPSPENRGPGGGCQSDSDCGAQAICNNGQCDTTHCHRDAQCASLLCLGADGGAGICAARQCTQNADCGQAFVCRRIGALIGCVPGCDTTADCPAPHICSHEFTTFGSCVGQCRTDADCGAGGYCYSTTDGGITTCIAYQLTNCHSDAECAGCLTCTSQNPNVAGICTSQNFNFDGGPPVLGNRAALTMEDNLASTVAFVQSTVPGSGLVRVSGSNLHADGTVGIADPSDMLSDWVYAFVTGDGGALAVYFNSRARKCGAVLLNGSTESTPPIADAAVGQLLSPGAFIANFTAQPRCQAWQGTSSDSYSVIGQQDGGALLYVATKNGDSFFGDALTGQGTFTCP